MIECPRCRRLSEASVLRRETDVTSHLATSEKEVTDEKGKNGNETVKNFSYDKREDLVGTGLRGVGDRILVHSYLAPERSKRLDVSKTLFVDWFRRGEKDEELLNDNVSLPNKDISDAEFLERLNSKVPNIQRARPSATQPLYHERVSFTTLVDWPKLSIWSGGVFLIVFLALAVTWVTIRMTRPEALRASIEAPTPATVDGTIAFRTRSGKIEGDDGAFIFLFPKDKKFESPLVYYGAEPSKKLPLEFDDFLNELKKNGGYFERVGFEGYFTFESVEPGEYYVLIVSFNLSGELGNDDKKALKEIGNYLFKPENMLKRNKYLWKNASIAGERVDLEYDLGREVL